MPFSGAGPSQHPKKSPSLTEPNHSAMTTQASSSQTDPLTKEIQDVNDPLLSREDLINVLRSGSPFADTTAPPENSSVSMRRSTKSSILPSPTYGAKRKGWKYPKLTGGYCFEGESVFRFKSIAQYLGNPIRIPVHITRTLRCIINSAASDVRPNRENLFWQLRFLHCSS